MPLPLLQTKLYIPPPRQHLVSRPAITAKLRAGLLQPVTLIAAPAGFGKTTLVSEWIAQASQAVAWLSLDDDDNDPTRFLTYLIAALQIQQPQIGATAQGVLTAPQVPPPKAILTLLLNDLATLTAPLVLVLDDYHLMTTAAIHNVTGFVIISSLPRCCAPACNKQRTRPQARSKQRSLNSINGLVAGMNNMACAAKPSIMRWRVVRSSKPCGWAEPMTH